MNRWKLAQEIEIPSHIQNAIGRHPLVTQTLARRGYFDLEDIRGFLDPDAYHPSSPYDLPGMDDVVESLDKAIRQKKIICVWGDFDVDGQTSTTVLVSALSKLGGKVVFHIPVRKEESHGVNLPNLKRIIDSGAELILTCDTGISAVEEIAYARQRGVDILVTDHHDLPEHLPSANAIINPKMLPSDHPLANLPGVGVAYQVADALLQKNGDDETQQSFLDLVALGIVADLALLTKDTRFLLQKGLQILRQNQRFGLQVMLEIAELDPGLLSEEHIAFEIAPRLNAVGRLGNANDIVEFFTTDDRGKARLMAYQLEVLNEKRKLDTKHVFQAALAQIKTDPDLLKSSVLVLSHPSWPAGIIGIVASRLVERYQKPTLLISTPFGDMGRGSARSIPGVNITAAIAAHKDMLGSYGGHPMAAGFSIPADEDIETTITKFRKAISKTVSKMEDDTPAEPRVFDGYLPLNNLSDELVDDFECLAPFGAGNPALTLVSQNMEIINHTPLGKTQEHLLVSVKDEQQNAFRIVWWQGAGWDIPEGIFNLVYRARPINASGKKDIQIEWVDAQPPEKTTVQLHPKIRFEIVDYRGDINPVRKLHELQNQESIQIWGEGDENPPQSSHRFALYPGDALAIWSLPPGWDEIRAVIDLVKPKKIYLFAVDPGLEHFTEFTKRLIAFIKYSIAHYQGVIDPKLIAAKTAHKEVSVRAAIDWLITAGYFTLHTQEGSSLYLSPGTKKLESDQIIKNRLDFLLQETAAFRKMYKNIDIETLQKYMSD
ncbi:MAG: single-stranded-DNA-specific exonuclease RecJ [Anaerolineales bacterium]|nr:single-stranded-DNA-specific exonuclease RecJ [Anaerolineales bacterium]